MNEAAQREMKMELSIRLRDMLRWRGMRQQAFATATGIPYKTIRRYLEGRSMPGAEHLARLAMIGVDVLWLLTGRSSGPMSQFVPDTPSNFAAFGDIWYQAELYSLLLDEFDAHHRTLQEAGEATPSFDAFMLVGREHFRRCLIVAETFREHLEKHMAGGITVDKIAHVTVMSLGELFPVDGKSGSEPAATHRDRGEAAWRRPGDARQATHMHRRKR